MKEIIKNLTFELPSQNSKKYEKSKIIDNSKSQQNRFILERKIMTKTYNPLSEIQKNFNDDGKYFVSKTRRIGKYNPNKKIIDKVIILDTRNEIVQTPKNQNGFNGKPNYLEYRNKKYNMFDKSKKIYPQKIIRLKAYSIDSIPNYFFKNVKPYNYSLNYIPKESEKKDKSLYSLVSHEKNKFMEEYNKAKENEKKWNIFPKKRQFIMDRTPLANFYSRKKNIKKFISPKNAPLPYISLLNDDYLFSEKLRFQNMMQKLTKLKLCLESNPKKEYDIVKEFLLNNKLFEIENFTTEKLKNFLYFIRGDFLLDPAKNFKENILDILNGNEIEKPKISNEMNDLKDADFEIELIKQNVGNMQNNLKKSLTDDNENCIVKNLRRYPLKINSNQNDNNIKSISNHRKPKKKEDIDKSFENIYPKFLTKSEMIERLLNKKYHEKEKIQNNNNNYTSKEKEKIKNFICLPLNLRRQTEIGLSSINDNLDLNKKPEFIIGLLEKKFKEEEKENLELRAKTVSNWKKILKLKNEKLYGEKKNNSDYEELKKRKMLTEYICLMKAKNKYEINKLEGKYKI